MKTIKFLSILLFGFLILSCEEKDQPCPEDLICTTEFKTITVSITDSQGNPVILDSVRIVNTDTSEEYNFEGSDLSPDEGSYLLLTDGQMKEINRSGNNFSFTGFQNGNEVVSRAFKIGHSCCHIQLLAGNIEIQI